MASLPEVLASVDGLRGDVAKRLEGLFPNVSALAEASIDDLKDIKGIGDVMAGRILQAAIRARSTADPVKVARDSTARTAAAAGKAIGTAGRAAGTAVSGSEFATQAVRDAEATARTGVYRLHARSDETLAKSVEAAEDSAALARSVADRVVNTAMGVAGEAKGLADQALGVTTSVAKAALAPARKVLRGLLGKR